MGGYSYCPVAGAQVTCIPVKEKVKEHTFGNDEYLERMGIRDTSRDEIELTDEDDDLLRDLEDEDEWE